LTPKAPATVQAARSAPGVGGRAADWPTRHAAEVHACRKCPGVEPPPVLVPLAGRVEVLLVGQAPGPRERDSGRLFAYTAGTRLFSWFSTLGVSEEDFRARVWISATIRCFPGREVGGDRPPSPEEVERCAPYLARELERLRPRTVIAVGGLAIGRFLEPAPLKERVGKVFDLERQGGGGERAYQLVPLPHPSGRSTWFNRPEHRLLLEQGLSGLASTAGWRAAFSER
jgi:uracil-DNA glycosylase